MAKSGRTTGYVPGRYVGVGETVNVRFGSFTARFVDQDLYSGNMFAGVASGYAVSGGVYQVDTLRNGGFPPATWGRWSRCAWQGL